MRLAATPLKLTYTSGKARSGVKVAVTGQPLKAVKLQLSLSSRRCASTSWRPR